ncbi:GNAT family N-acetyltransferase [Sphingomonas alba]|uniref:GNAT family N-acetyltransferase n=1 Tax=Sphingomonas alba TaxID=2908208 RepID=A0ABT0RQ56_9SPHN|nr:GNAT family N-acetyltransferase [Sphingomonas alba]MCL6684688.1 GNAT family N-acetyltransferase [Sphingomonas alba]
MVALIGELEFSVDAAGVAARLHSLAECGEPVLLAETGGEVVGLLDWHVMTTIHRPHPVGRLVALVVAKGHRGRGIGKALVAEAERRMRARGCEKMEVTSNMQLIRAHEFYEGLGLERSSFRFAKNL